MYIRKDILKYVKKTLLVIYLKKAMKLGQRADIHFLNVKTDDRDLQI